MRNSKEITVIVPKLPPSIDGIGDYGLRLAQQLYQDLGWKTHFIVGTPEWQGETEGEFFCVSTVAARSQTALLKLLPAAPATVLLHYAGHGYANRGCPFWLVQALAQWCQSGGRLITLFHELYATSPLLSSALLTSPFQKRLATQVMELSDRVLTNQKQYAEKIDQLSHHKHSAIPTLPVFSNVGEIEQPLPLNQRSRRLIVFGGGGLRTAAYGRSRSALIKACTELDIEEIIDIGSPLKFQPEPIPDVALKTLGVQPLTEISRYMSSAIAGFLDYPTAYLGKSTIFAAYCSHGMIPIVSSKKTPNLDGLKSNQHYWLADSKQILDIEQAQAIVHTAHAWYHAHNLRTQSAIFAASLGLEKNTSEIFPYKH
ncbi:glycosyltransferase family 1 protein [Cyanobacteria bacterium FACHB-63]|nr:glycosyltransferase family 1 protein [Cyanobacteria bacterium FACHB-63]